MTKLERLEINGVKSGDMADMVEHAPTATCPWTSQVHSMKATSWNEGGGEVFALGHHGTGDKKDGKPVEVSKTCPSRAELSCRDTRWKA